MPTQFTTTSASSPSIGESTLSGTRTELKRRIGRFLGISRDYTKWNTKTTDDVNDAIKSGERNFYLPNGHTWSFLRQIMEITTADGDYVYDLPDDFGGFLTTWLNFTDTDNKTFPVRHTGIPEILQLQAQNITTTASQPELFAVQAQSSDRTGGQRWEILLYPTPSDASTLTGPYYALPWAISDAAPYPLGGQPHFECLAEACLAAAELSMNGEIGAHDAKFKELLAAAISFDKRSGTKVLGYNWDRKTQQQILPPIRGNLVTYNSLPLIS